VREDRDTEAPRAAVDPGELFTLPESGEALLTVKQFACALGISETSLWAWARNDPEFPRPVRRGERFTRFKLTDARSYIESLQTGVRGPRPAERRLIAGGAQP
jgi:predicted DNA-binding transcriptional regulator AlpA